MQNTLYYGDNLDILRRYVADESVDLVYLDPPFKSDANYNVLFAEKDGSQAAAQIQAFTDTWTWNQESEKTFADLVQAGGKVSDCMQAFRTFLGPCDMLAYLVMMAPRLVELRRAMKPAASIYLHCDPTASHYLKVLMDAVFARMIVNEIVWHYRKWPTGKYAFQRNHDVILFYARGRAADRTFNQLYMDRAPSTLKRFGKAKIASGHDADGNRVPSVTTGEESAGVRMDDVWDIGRVPPIKQLFPTQKPSALLERIITASSNPGDVVLDPFCGCGTSIDAAQGLGRQWIGIDVTHLAIYLMKRRLRDRYGLEPAVGKHGGDYQVIGEPVSLPDAEALAAADPYQFQWWSLGLVGARPVEQKKGADKGIDGKIIFQGDKPGTFETIILSVKAGHTQRSHVHELRGVVEREKAAIGVLITMQESTGPMREDAVTAGFWHSGMWNKDYPKIQLLTVAEILDGRQIEMPPQKQVSQTFRKAAKAKGRPSHVQPNLFDAGDDA